MTTHLESDGEVRSVAVVGMAGRFPGARNVRELWANLCAGVESISFFSEEELDPSIEPALLKDPAYVRARGVLEDAEGFDASFFAISPREAQLLDPQHRVLLETAWEALEDAGCDPGVFEGLIGVFAGAGFNTYLMNHVLPNQALFRAVGEHQTILTNAPDYLATRVSFKLDLKGPSISLFTGCSTSLVAVSYAVDSLLNYQSDLALAGGSFVWCPQRSGYLYEEGEIFSKDGHCRPFDAHANGTVFSNGVGLVALKRLEEALDDGDHIYAVIRGTAVNNDGSSKMSFAAPSVEAQSEVVAMAMANAGVTPDTIGYIEAHGTGTIIGDPIEIEALNRAFRAGTSAREFCAIGSLKGNVGHLDAAAGIAGLIKAALALKHEVIPPSINFQEPNPQIDFPASPFYVNTELRNWPRGSMPRRAGVTSLGVGGTNVHVVLEEPPLKAESEGSRPLQLLLLSARNESGLDRATEGLSRHLSDNPSTNMADAAFTLQTGRRGFEFRRFVVCESVADHAVEALKTLPSGRSMSRQAPAGVPDVVFMFPGQGSQYVNMGLELYEREEVFRRSLDECIHILNGVLARDLRDIIHPKTDDLEGAANLLRQTGFQQPALFAIEYSLAKLWNHWGVEASAMIGHSIGEFVAACLAGVFSLEDALRVVAARGRMMQELPGGSMLSVRLPAEAVQPRLHEQLSLAAVNAPELCVVSGPTDAVEAFRVDLEKEEILSRLLHTSHAFHSPMMDSIVEPFAELMSTVSLSPPRIPYVSTATGTWVTAEEATDPLFWGRQLRRTVRFAEGISTLWEKPERVLLEVGPGTTAVTLARPQVTDPAKQVAVSSLGTSADDRGELDAVLQAVGRLWLAGVSLDWKAFHGRERRVRTPLPTYPFQRQRHWIDAVVKDQDALPNVGAPRATLSSGSALLKDEPTEASTGSAGAHPGGGHPPPETEIERKIADLWREVLGVERPQPRDNFFDLGGDSMLAARLIARMQKVFEQRLTAAEFYREPTIRGLAALLAPAPSSREAPAPSQRMPPSGGEEPYELFIGDVAANKKDVLGLWERNFPALKGDRYAWTYEGNPAGVATCLFVKDTRDASIVGVHAVFPRRVFVNGREYTAGLGADFAVDKEHRILAPAVMLQEEIISQCNQGKFDFYFGFPNKESESVNQILGLTMFDVLRLTKPLRSHYHIKKAFDVPVISQALAGTFDIASRSVSKEIRYRAPKGLASGVLQAFDKRFDRLLERVSNQLPVIGERSSSYLTWRYFSSPGTAPSIFCLFEEATDDILGYLVFHTNGKQTDIADLICIDFDDTLDALLSLFLLFQRQCEVDAVSIRFAGNKRLVKKLQEFGFSIRDKEDKVTVYAPPHSPLLSCVFDEDNLYLLAGDKDI